jgi:predicted nuclease of predicted toxin-antitoxin system
MKLLLDENLSRRIIPLLDEHYPGSTQVALIGLERAVDQEIWQYAKENNFVILTQDSDYYDLSLVQGAPPKVIWLKTGNSSKKFIAELLLSKKLIICDLLNQKDLKCIELY